MSHGYHAAMDGITWAASAMVAARARLDIATHNLANTSSDGFRRTAARGSLDPRGVRITEVRSNAQGPLRRTGRPFDLAIVGSGTFSVRDARGVVAETRNGSFTRDPNGFVRDDGGRVLLARGVPLRLGSGEQIGERSDIVPGASVRSGFLEASDVDAVSEMIDVLTAQRSFESAQKVVSAIDQTRQKASNELARLK